jgi:hypothetical protein
MNNLNQGNRCSGRDSSRVPPEYKSALPAEPTCSVAQSHPIHIISITQWRLVA